MISFITLYIVLSQICKQEVIISYNCYLFIISIFNETYHVNKGVIVSISNTIYIITLVLPKSDNNIICIYKQILILPFLRTIHP